MGVAASFEAYFEKEQFDEAMAMSPILARESEVRYLPRLNVALLKASDKMVELERYNDAAILLNLVKTNDVIIKNYEMSIAGKQERTNLLNSLDRKTEETESEL